MELTSTELQKSPGAGSLQGTWYISANTKHSIIYSAVFLLITAVFSYLFAQGLANGLPTIIERYIFAGIFLVVGFAHFYYFPRLLPQLYRAEGFKGLIYCFVLTILITDCILMLFYLTSVHNIGLAVAGGCAFILPYIASQCSLYYRRIENKQYPGWRIPADIEVDKRKSLQLNSMFFQIKIKINYFDFNETLFNVNLPARLTLGNMFCRFLYDLDNIIEVNDSSDQPYAWLFSIRNRFEKRILDPNLTLEQNGIKESDIIFIERIRTPRENSNLQ
jgi:hypothetical protein